MPGWSRPAGLVYEEFKQAREEGKDPRLLEGMRLEAEVAGEDFEANDRLHAAMLALPVCAGFSYTEPEGWDAIQAVRAAGGMSARELDDCVVSRIHAAWLGRCIGCALGKPFEAMGMRGIDNGGMRPWKRLKAYLTAISPDEWPIRDYVPVHSPASADPLIGEVMCPDSTREKIAFAETDDDLRYMVVALTLLQKHGLDFTTRDVAANWLAKLPYRDVCTAETQAYHNLVARYEFHADAESGGKPQEIDWQWVATHRNPYREWIGAQIRVDVYGYAAAGNPARAAKMAWTDARMSHTKNGVYGAMFCAAMIAAAFVSNSPREIVLAGLAEIPPGSRLAEAIRKTVTIADETGSEDFEGLFERLNDAFESYSTVHTIPNAALCAAVILTSEGDFERAVTRAVMGAWDTDCNGATVGSVLGAMAGLEGIPAHWSKPLNNTLLSGIAGYHPIAISECAEQTARAAGFLK